MFQIYFEAISETKSQFDLSLTHLLPQNPAIKKRDGGSFNRI